jgi:subtilisin family serine protease
MLLSYLKRRFFIQSLAILTLVSVLPTGAQASEGATLVHNGQYIVTLKNTRSASASASDGLSHIADILETVNDTKLIELKIGASNGRPNGQLVELDEAAAKTWCDQIGMVADVANCEPNAHWTISAAPTDALYSELYGMRKISAESAWDMNTGSDAVIVAVTDTGVDYNHPDLSENMWRNPGEIAGNNIDDDGNGYVDDVFGIDTHEKDSDPMDDHGHGTHCAGTIGAKANNGVGVAGVNWNVKIMALKFLGAGGGGSTLDAIKLIDYAVENNAKVINASWGGYYASDALRQAIARAERAGVIFVAAAGNSASNNDERPHYPSSFDLSNVLAVAATDSDDNLAYFSNYGASAVDIAAPGHNILSTFPGGQYKFLSGTSMAAPHVAGLAALVISERGSGSHVETIAHVLDGDPLATLGGLVRSGRRINAYRALTGDGFSGGASISISPMALSTSTNPQSSRIRVNKPFYMDFQGTPNTAFSPSMELHGALESPCELGSFQTGADGVVRIYGKFKLAGFAKRWTKKVSLRSMPGREIQKRVQRRKGSGASVLKKKGMNKNQLHRLAVDASKSCKKIRESLYSE